VFCTVVLFARLQCAGDVFRVGEMKNACKILAGRVFGKRSLGTPWWGGGGGWKQPKIIMSNCGRWY
jgi:hypothetical protein